MRKSGRVVNIIAVWLVSAAAYTCSWALDVVLFAATPLFAIFSYACLFVLVLGGGASRVRKPTRADFFVFLFLFWVFLSCLWSYDSLTSFRLAYYYVLSFILFFLIEHLTFEPAAWRRVGVFFVLGAVTAGALLMSRAALYGISLDERETIGGINANYIAYSLATAIPILLGVAQGSSRGVIVRAFELAALVVLVGGTMVTGSRSGLFAAVIGLVFFWGFQGQRSLGYVFVALLLAVSVIFAFYDFLPEELRARIDLVEFFATGGGSVNENLSGRSDVWPLAFDYFSNNIIGGIGVGAFAVVNPYGFGVHNVPLSLAAELGVVGFLLYFLIIWAVMYQAIFRASNPVSRGVALNLLAVWIPISLSGVWESVPVAWAAFALVAALSCHPRQVSER
ncbi:O-antigen ligase family protein [Zoogloea sp.]|uniref:O-antigen ligase family protein n=1 Tax=Zoogloea sp. TaxID=49181 RepID=UPI002FE1DB51